MKLSITIECDDIDEYNQISQLLTDKQKVEKTKPESIPPKISQELQEIKSKDSYGERFIPLTNWNNYHEWPTIGGLRHLVFWAETNGFDSCIKRVGRRVIIDEKAFFEWLKKR